MLSEEASKLSPDYRWFGGSMTMPAPCHRTDTADSRDYSHPCIRRSEDERARKVLLKHHALINITRSSKRAVRSYTEQIIESDNMEHSAQQYAQLW
jgi:hypothetical protein